MTFQEHEHNWRIVEETVYRDGRNNAVHSIRIVKYCYGCKEIQEEIINNN